MRDHYPLLFFLPHSSHFLHAVNKHNKCSMKMRFRGCYLSYFSHNRNGRSITYCQHFIPNSIVPYLYWGQPRWLSWMRAKLVIRRSAVQSLPDLVTLFCGDWSWNIFYGPSLPSYDSRRAVVSFWQKKVHQYWLTAERTKPAQEKCVVRQTDWLDMTQWVDVKTKKQKKLYW